MADTRLLRDYPALTRHRAEQSAARRQRRIRLAVLLPLAALLVTSLYAWSPPAALMVAAIASMLLFFAFLPGSTSVDPGALAGIEGEVATLKQLLRLPDAYRIVNRVRLPDPRLPNGERELDFVISGPSGLWVVEVKNTPGLVQVVGGARHWPLSKRSGCSSCPSWNAMDNPEPQVRDQIDALKRWLLMNGVAAEPKGVICLAHPDVAIRDPDRAAYPVRVPGQLVQTISGTRAGTSGAPDLSAAGSTPWVPLLEPLREGRLDAAAQAAASVARTGGRSGPRPGRIRTASAARR
ncbi:nuclease-related domain-containing protein [Halomonas denitrificans]|nr:NERD domain-containing protein [Halomonas denitrificans]